MTCFVGMKPEQIQVDGLFVEQQSVPNYAPLPFLSSFIQNLDAKPRKLHQKTQN